MDTTILFLLGTVITLVAMTAVGAIWWAAIEDGRYHDAMTRGWDAGEFRAAPIDEPGDRASAASGA